MSNVSFFSSTVLTLDFLSHNFSHFFHFLLPSFIDALRICFSFPLILSLPLSPALLSPFSYFSGHWSSGCKQDFVSFTLNFLNLLTWSVSLDKINVQINKGITINCLNQVYCLHITCKSLYFMPLLVSKSLVFLWLCLLVQCHNFL